LIIIALQALVDRERTFILLSASHSTRVSIFTIAISLFYILIDKTREPISIAEK